MSASEEFIVRHYTDIGDRVGEHIVEVLMPGVPEPIRVSVGEAFHVRATLAVEHDHRKPGEF